VDRASRYLRADRTLTIEDQPVPEVVLVTGASSGIGQACADRLAARGWTVVGASRRGTSSGTWAPRVMDVDDEASVAVGMDAVIADHGRLDAVVTCAGWGLAGAVEDTPIGDARDQFETLFWGSVRVVQRALPVMRRQGRGRIVLMSSIGGVLGLPFQAFYTAAKFALEGYGEALGYEVAPFGIEVTLVEPGNVRTGFTAARRDVGPDAGTAGVVDDGESAYRQAAARAVGKMADDEAGGVDPGKVADVVVRVLGSNHPPRRVSVGKFDERIGITAKRLLPHRLFERAAKGSLGV
jgi:NAD(P)-dependent dehydrogenase (short-subunit alcohol dehydrogenase family)